MNECQVLPATGPCDFQCGLDPSGLPKKCPSKATMKLCDTKLCDRHAELAMTSICGRFVKIERKV